MAFSAGSRVKRLPVPRWKLSTCADSRWPGKASTRTSTGWPCLHVRKLRFLEIGRDPNVRIDHGKQRLAGLQVIAQLDGAMRDAAGDGGQDFGVRQIQLGLANGRLRPL